jgi:DnaJ like chaperone protein
MKESDKDIGFGVIYCEKIKPFCAEARKTLKTLCDMAVDLLPASEKLKEKASFLRKVIKLHISYDLHYLSVKDAEGQLFKFLIAFFCFLICFFLGSGFWGTLLLAVFGVALGLILGHFLDILCNPQQFLVYKMTRTAKPLAYSAHSAEISMRAFTSAFTGLLAGVAARDRGITADEEDLYLSFVSAAQDEESAYKEAFAAAAKSDLHACLNQIKLVLGDNTDVYPLLLDLLFSMAAADGDVGKSEFKLIKDISQSLNISDEMFSSVSSAYYVPENQNKPKTKRDDFEILGLDRNATKDEIRRAWITLVQQNHPDRLSGSGADNKKIEEANETLAEINAAYNRLMKF